MDNDTIVYQKVIIILAVVPWATRGSQENAAKGFSGSPDLGKKLGTSRTVTFSRSQLHTPLSHSGIMLIR